MGITQGSIMGLIKGDTSRLDDSSTTNFRVLCTTVDTKGPVLPSALGNM